MTSFLVVYENQQQVVLNVSQIITIEEQPGGACQITVADPTRKKPIRPEETFTEVMSTVININRASPGPYERAFHNQYSA